MSASVEATMQDQLLWFSVEIWCYDPFYLMAHFSWLHPIALIWLQMPSITPWKLWKRSKWKGNVLEGGEKKLGEIWGKYLKWASERNQDEKLALERTKFPQQSRKRHLNLLFHLGVWQLLQCRLLILSVSYFIHKSRGVRDAGRARRTGERCRSSLFWLGPCVLTRLMMYGNACYAGWLLTRGRPPSASRGECVEFWDTLKKAVH